MLVLLSETDWVHIENILGGLATLIVIVLAFVGFYKGYFRL